MANLNNDGWLKIWRELLSKPIWKLSSPEQAKVLITVMLLANHEENEWEWKGKKYSCKPGQLVTSLNSLADACGNGVSIKNVRTSLERFEKLGFLANESAKTGRLITIVNWEKYQGETGRPGKVTGKDPAKRRQSTGKEPATNKKDKNDKKDKNERKKIMPSAPEKEVFEGTFEEWLAKQGGENGTV